MQEDLFPEFSVRALRGGNTEVFVRVGGRGPPLLLLHGYPETHVCWHRVARQLAERYTVIACDLPGYGRSASLRECERTGPSFSKREMAGDLIAAISELGFSEFSVVGHDRDGRVAYRMALDHPAAVVSLTVVSILPTSAMWSRLESNDFATKAFRWFFRLHGERVLLTVPVRSVAIGRRLSLQQTARPHTSAAFREPGFRSIMISAAYWRPLARRRVRAGASREWRRRRAIHWLR
jgi:pimeloyl-ACP methyl ester carboxylesterase